MEFRAIPEGRVFIQVFNVLGQSVLAQTIDAAATQSAPLDISSLQNGMYLIQFTAPGGNVLNKRVVREKLN